MPRRRGADVDDATPAVPVVLVEVLASNVTIDGFTLTGRNDALGTTTNPSAELLTDTNIYAQAAAAITSYDPKSAAEMNGASVSSSSYPSLPSNVVIQNNVIEDVSYIGVDLGQKSNGTLSTGNTITQNVIQNVGYNNDEGAGVRLFYNFYDNITHNTITNVREGVDLESFGGLTPTSGGGSVEFNTIDARRRGVFYNNSFAGAAALPVEYNTIDAVSDDPTIVSSASLWTGVYVITQYANVPATFLDNTIDGVGSSYATTAGYTVINTFAGNLVSISGDANSLNSIENVTYGVWIDSAAPNGFGAAGAPMSISLSGLDFSNVTDGVFVDSDPSNPEIISAAISGGSISTATGGVGVDVSGVGATATVTAVTISGGSVGVDVENGASATITQNTLNGNSAGVSLSGATHNTSITHNFIENNSIGVLVNSGATGAGPILSNSFTGNTFGLFNLSSTALRALDDWWASSAGPDIANNNPGG